MICVCLLHQKGNETAWKILGERRDEHEPIELARWQCLIWFAGETNRSCIGTNRIRIMDNLELILSSLPRGAHENSARPTDYLLTSRQVPITTACKKRYLPSSTDTSKGKPLPRVISMQLSPSYSIQAGSKRRLCSVDRVGCSSGSRWDLAVGTPYFACLKISLRPSCLM